MDKKTICALGFFADMLEYPASLSIWPSGMAERARECAALLEGDAKDLLAVFSEDISFKKCGEMEEIFTATFDFRPDCALHVGAHLFGGGDSTGGGDTRRGIFMAGLNEYYKACGFQFSPGQEMPDHLVVMLRFLCHLERSRSWEAEKEKALELVSECIIPTVEKILTALDGNGGKNPYAPLLKAIIIFLADTEVCK